MIRTGILNSDSLTTANSARRRIAGRLLPYVFLMYVICYVDRANVSFANLRMSADLGFSDRTYGLGVGMFFIGYVLFEIPGAIMVERWSARKWIARIMLTWGMATILTGFVHTARQFYAARFFVGMAEASFFPGVIVYLTHWFRKEDRAKAIASFFTAVPAAMVLGSLIANWLLGVHWKGLTGWRWIFIAEGIPPIVLGIVTLFYLTDRPMQAKWLTSAEREWISRELEQEKLAKKQVRDYGIVEAMCDRRIILLMIAFFLGLMGALSSMYWVPTFIKRMSGLPNSTVTSLAALPGVIGIAAMLLNAWHSDKTGERRWHAAVPLFCAGVAHLALLFLRQNVAGSVSLLIIGGGLMFAYYPVFWSIPTMVLTESAAAVCFGLITSVGQSGGFVGPYAVGYLNQRSGSLLPAFALIGGSYVAAAFLLSTIRIDMPSLVATPIVVAEDRMAADS